MLQLDSGVLFSGRKKGADQATKRRGGPLNVVLIEANLKRLHTHTVILVIRHSREDRPVETVGKKRKATWLPRLGWEGCTGGMRKVFGPVGLLCVNSVMADTCHYMIHGNVHRRDNTKNEP